jgi:transglutaminase-like putative cysteine protease
MPLTDDDQTCLDFRLFVEPHARIFAYDLPSGRVHHFAVRAPHHALTIHAESLVVTHRHNPFELLQLHADDFAFYHQEAIRQRYIEYLLPTERVPLPEETERIAAIARRQSGSSAGSFLVALNRLLHKVFDYRPGSTHVNTTIQHVLEQQEGVCQDFAHLMLAVCRREGIPARYVSGYLYTGIDTPEDIEEEIWEDTEERRWLEGRDAPRPHTRPRPLVNGDAMHAWVECLMPDETWRGFDPTNNIVTNAHYVKVHYGRDYGDVPPVRGIFRGPHEHGLHVAVRVTNDRL